jgi:hypothetical protein
VRPPPADADAGGPTDLVRARAAAGWPLDPPGAELQRVEIPSRFTHDVVRTEDRVFVCDTGNGQILEYEFPAMKLVGGA